MNDREKALIDEQVKNLLDYYNSGQKNEAEELALSITEKFPDNQFSWKVLGVLWLKNNEISKAFYAMNKAIELSPSDPSSLYNLGLALKEIGKLDEAEETYRKVIKLKNNYPEVHNNLGVVLQAMGRTEEAQKSFKEEISNNPSYASAFWNLYGCSKTLQESEYWINKCLDADNDHLKAKLTKAALNYYKDYKNDFLSLMNSKFKDHSYMRSFNWVFSLPKLPDLHFNVWYFFDSVINKSIISRPFYEYGVWRAASFKYLINVFKRGFGFDTFTGLPEDWYLGKSVEQAGTYSSGGDVPIIEGGEFIVGKFEDTLPIFFSKNRPKASIINFDADLYSSTICALNYSKEIIDKDTILIFDEFIMNENWEEDEFKALNEFCSNHSCKFEVLAVSFFTKQVAIKLVGI